MQAVQRLRAAGTWRDGSAGCDDALTAGASHPAVTATRSPDGANKSDWSRPLTAAVTATTPYNHGHSRTSLDP